jgi:1A family penicillin-binding protein
MMKSKKKAVKKIVLWGGIIVVGLCILGAGFIFIISASLPSIEEIVTRQIPESTKIYDRTGTILLYESGGTQKRTVLPADQIPSSLKDATVAIEDARFYQEPAFDVRGILRALYVDLLSGSASQGASTITQQLARNAFLSPERTLTRKIKELLLAIKLNQYYTKDQILTLYLNEIPYGPTAYGVESASRLFFGKSASDLDLAESALLAAIPKAPSYYSPWGTHAKELIARQKVVLNRMYSLGKISKIDLAQALAENLTFQPQSEGSIKAPHFVMMIQDYLASKYGEDMVQTGGLKVTTTLDYGLQQQAENAVSVGAARNLQLYKGGNAAMVVEDPRTGQILALVGSHDFFDTAHDGNFDVATQGLRQPGSSLKPFVYMTAFEKGFNPNTVLYDVPTEFSAQNPACPALPDFGNSQKQCFHPQNYDEQFRGPVTLRNALAQSINVPAVKMLYLAGMNNVIKTAQDFGLQTLNDPSRYGLSLVLGGGAVRLIDLVEAYSTLASEGLKHVQSSVLEVKNSSGQILESYKDSSVQVVDPQYPRLVTDILKDAVARQPLYQNSMNLTTYPGYEVAMKTGTSNDYHDAWVVGYTPSLVAGVWAGNNDNSPMQKSGGSILAAVPIWHAFMTEALQKYQPETFTPPDMTPSVKPILNGVYAPDGAAHTILYYIDKNDPEGAAPRNPGDDPQFANWETSVQNWARMNPSAIAAGAGSSLGTSGVQIVSPTSTDVSSGPISVQAIIHASSSLSFINVYVNGVLAHQEAGNFGTSYTLNYSFDPQTTKPQNLLEVEGVTEDNARVKDGVVFYR